MVPERVLGEGNRKPLGKIEPDGTGTKLWTSISRNAPTTFTATLTVDDFPRAFTFKLRRNPNLQFEPEDPTPAGIRIVSPSPRSPKPAYKASEAKALSIVVQVDADEEDFDDPERYFEIGVDENQDGEIDFSRRKFHSLRQVRIELVKLGANGEMRVGTRVSDFEIPVDPEGLSDAEVDVVARLDLGGGRGKDDRVSVYLDGRPPKVAPMELPPVVKGKPALIRVIALDSLSGIAERNVEAVVDLEGRGEFGKQKLLYADLVRPDLNQWLFTVSTQALEENRNYTLLVRATDRAGNQAAVEPIAFRVIPKPKPTGAGGTSEGGGKKKPRTDTSLVGVVWYYDELAANVEVVLEKKEAAPRTTKTDSKG
ncbi:MAG: hypothetical protein N2C14_25135, partial [Planctomycetales bacterium]